MDRIHYARRRAYIQQGSCTISLTDSRQHTLANATLNTLHTWLRHRSAGKNRLALLVHTCATGSEHERMPFHRSLAYGDILASTCRKRHGRSREKLTKETTENISGICPS